MSVVPSMLRRCCWYAVRLGAMAPGEMLHRIAEAARKSRWRRDDRRWDAFASIGDGPLADLRALRDRFRAARINDLQSPAAAGLERILAGEFQFFGKQWPQTSLTRGHALPARLWFHDPLTGKSWPGKERSCFDVDIRSTGTDLGDVKYVWELNRLQALHPLAFAIADGGSVRLREAALAILENWAEANPPYRGVNWISGIEIAMRLVSFVLIAAAFEPETLTRPQRTLIRRLVAAHARYLHGFPSLYSSANNHRVAEGLGLFIAGALVPDLPEARIWKEEGRQVLATEAERQILVDGVGVEQSPLYQAFVMEMLAFAVRLAEDIEEPFAPKLTERLVAGAKFLLWLADDNGLVPAIGDDDESRVLAQPPDREPRYVASVIAAVAGLARRPDLAPPARDLHLRDYLFDSPPVCETPPLRSGLQVFSAYTCAKETIAGRRCHIVFDHGPLGLHPLCAHGHADALAIWLTIEDQPIFIDAGTYLYFSGLDTRTRLRESLAHNTVSVAGRSQSQAWPAFSWSTRADARLLHVVPEANWSATAAQDGYRRRFGVRHVRRVQRVCSGYAIRDALEGARRALPVTINFLCHPDLQIRAASDRTVVIIGQRQQLCRITSPRDFSIRVEREQSASDSAARCSSAFGHVGPTTQVVLAGVLGSRPVTTLIELAAHGAAKPLAALAADQRSLQPEFAATLIEVASPHIPEEELADVGIDQFDGCPARAGCRVEQPARRG
jgi:uncharacterized heparinase superfamily protein